MQTEAEGLLFLHDLLGLHPTMPPLLVGTAVSALRGVEPVLIRRQRTVLTILLLTGSRVALTRAHFIMASSDLVTCAHL